MQALCHCSKLATVTVHGLLICPKCEDFLARHPALETTLLEQWRAKQVVPQVVPQVEPQVEPGPEVQA